MNRRRHTKPRPPRQASDRVWVGWLTGGTVPAEFAESLAGTVAHDLLRRDRGLEPQIESIRCLRSGVNVCAGRNGLVVEFLATSTAPWFLMVDGDMSWRPDSVERLLATADAADRPVVGGLCFGWTGGPDNAYGPTLYGLHQREFALGRDVVRIDGTGLAFLLVHRTVLEAIRDRGFSQAWPWFQETERNGRVVTEEEEFCARIADCGFPIHVDTSIEVRHSKASVLTLEGYARQVQAGARGYALPGGSSRLGLSTSARDQVPDPTR